MRIKERIEANKVVVLAISGKVMGGPDAQTFQDKLRGLLAEGFKKIVLDMGKVGFMNSSGLGILISGLKTVREKGGEMKLSNVTKKIENLLMVTKLITIFETFETTERAVASYSD